MFISSAWFDKAERATFEESAQLQLVDSRSRFSRLACCVTLTPEMSGMVASVAPVDHGDDVV